MAFADPLFEKADPQSKKADPSRFARLHPAFQESRPEIEKKAGLFFGLQTCRAKFQTQSLALRLAFSASHAAFAG